MLVARRLGSLVVHLAYFMQAKKEALHCCCSFCSLLELIMLQLLLLRPAAALLILLPLLLLLLTLRSSSSRARHPDRAADRPARCPSSPRARCPPRALPLRRSAFSRRLARTMYAIPGFFGLGGQARRRRRPVEGGARGCRRGRAGAGVRAGCVGSIKGEPTRGYGERTRPCFQQRVSTMYIEGLLELELHRRP